MSFVLLLTGCWSHRTVTRDTPLPSSTTELIIRLQDGRCIFSKTCERVENGYSVVGTLVSKENNTSRDFSGIISDEEIKEVVTNEYDGVKTVGAVVLTVSIFLVGVGLAIAESMSSY